jgi:hypothetical protein
VSDICGNETTIETPRCRRSGRRPLRLVIQKPMEKMFQSAQIRLRFIQSKLDLEGWNPELYPLFASKQVSEDVRRHMQLGSTRICRHNRPSTTFSPNHQSALLLVVFSGNWSRGPLEYVAGNLAGDPCNSGHLPNVFLYSQCRGRFRRR